ncbi:hypothetical protein RCMENCHIE_141 [Rhodobacter phage RcMenchie]|nr:hypothetical protein RCTIPTONUS_139 [Rhodobacter phage RcTiptonus]UUV44510.1 hypothetical protein RCMENCHIE_141 [Rhodobacter phage RcMenchie]
MQLKAKAPAKAAADKAAKAAPAKAAAPVAAPAPVAAKAPRVPVNPETLYRSEKRDAQTVIAAATNFGQYSDRDTAYLAFFGSVMRQHGGKATLAQLHNAGKPVTGTSRRLNPHYTGSAKATDAGAINRLIKAGYLTASADGQTLTATDAAKAQAAYNKH